MRIKGYTRSDGVKVKGHKRKGKKTSKREYERKYSKSQRRAHAKSRTSKSGHKTYKERMKQEKSGKGRAGLWSHVWAKRKRGK